MDFTALCHSTMKKPFKITVKDSDAVLKKARRHFQRVLDQVFGQPAFILSKDDAGLVPGALVTDILFLSRFVEMFGDLVENENYEIETYKARNEEGDFKIGEHVLERWRTEGCLRE